MKKQIPAKSPILIRKSLSVKAYIKNKKNEIVNQEINLEKRISNQMTEANLNCSPVYDQLIVFSYDKKDCDGTWSWGMSRNWEEENEYKTKIEEFHKNYHNNKSWGEALEETTGPPNKRRKKHVFYPLDRIIKEAHNRLVELNMDDFESIFRFRLSGKFRFFGCVIGNVFLVIWHYPNHEIYDD